MADLTPIYVAHPLGAGNDREFNRRLASMWTAWLADRYCVAPVCTWITLAEQWDESRRELGLAIDRALIEMVGTVVLCGTRVSPGMELEIMWATTVINLTSPGALIPDMLQESQLGAIDREMATYGIRRRDG